MTKSAIERIDDLISEVDQIRGKFGNGDLNSSVLTIDLSNVGTLQVQPTGLTPNNSFQDLKDTSTTSLDSSSAILNLSSDIDEIMIKNLLDSDQNYTTEDTGWLNLIKAFPLERNVKQGIISKEEYGLNDPPPFDDSINQLSNNLVYRTDLKVWTIVPDDSFRFGKEIKPQPFLNRQQSFKFSKKKIEPKISSKLDMKTKKKPKIQIVPDSLVINRTFNDPVDDQQYQFSSPELSKSKGSSPSTKKSKLQLHASRTRSQSIDELTKSADSSPLVEIRSKKRNQERITIIL